MQGLGIGHTKQLFLTHCCKAAKWNCFHTQLQWEGRRDTAFSTEGEMNWLGVKEGSL